MRIPVGLSQAPWRAYERIRCSRRLVRGWNCPFDRLPQAIFVRIRRTLCWPHGFARPDAALLRDRTGFPHVTQLNSVVEATEPPHRNAFAGFSLWPDCPAHSDSREKAGEHFLNISLHPPYRPQQVSDVPFGSKSMPDLRPHLEQWNPAPCSLVPGNHQYRRTTRADMRHVPVRADFPGAGRPSFERPF